MKKRWKITLGITVAAVVIALIAGLVFWRGDYVQRLRERRFSALWEEGIKDGQQRRVLLLCETDHEALLKAGREILDQIPEDYLDTDGKRVAGVLHLPKGVRIPEIIQDIRPRGFFVDYDGYLIMEMHGGMDHFGVRIYPEDYKEPDRYFKYIDRELLPGLWYYDDGYIHNPEYDKRIDTLIEKNKNK
ncbi:MAG: hypothetical protein ACYS7Y_32475 [Planctomycetota bacterium]|jgi:hypothetical protein